MAADGFQFAFTPEVEAQTAPVWEKVQRTRHARWNGAPRPR